MNHVMTILWSDTLWSIAGIVIGVLLVVYRKPFARKSVRQQNALWGFRMGERDVRITEIVAIPIGIGWIVLGIWGLVDSLG
jgi:hypothetical protein